MAGIEWQPIDTAPKDATEILGFQPGFVLDAGIYVCRWHWDDDEKEDTGQWDMFYPFTDADGEYKVEPTHWMPLPEPPQ